MYSSLKYLSVYAYAYATLLVPITVNAQFPPDPEGITILKSRFNENITISYKEVSTKKNYNHWIILVALPDPQVSIFLARTM